MALFIMKIFLSLFFHFRSSLYEVLDHLSSIANLSGANSMTAENLSMSLLKVNRDTIAMVMFKQNNAIEFLITNYQKIKGIKEKG